MKKSKKVSVNLEMNALSLISKIGYKLDTLTIRLVENKTA